MKIGIDVGGTNTVVAAVENDTVIHKISVPTNTNLHGAQFLTWLKNLVVKGLAISAPDVAVALPGLVKGNMLIHAPALPYCDRLVFEKWRICNDADAAALAEHTYGAAKGAQNAVVITFGTSIGAGVISAGKQTPGCEAGHMIIDVENNGEWASLASTSALVARCQTNYPEAKWAQNGKTILEAAIKGEPPAREQVAKHIPLMAIGISNMINILSPEIVVIGGEISESFDYYGGELRKQVEKLSIFPDTTPPIVAARFGGDAGVIGACI